MSREADVLIGALLDRLGNTAAQTLLARLDHWLAAEAHTNTNRFDRDQIYAIEGPYDRRRQHGNRINLRNLESASPTAKDKQP